jgi:hypothetical protein
MVVLKVQDHYAKFVSSGGDGSGVLKRRAAGQGGRSRQQAAKKKDLIFPISRLAVGFGLDVRCLSLD